MLALNLAEDEIQDRVRERLTSERIWLYREPYYDEANDKPKPEEIRVLATRYAAQLVLPEGAVLQALFHVQRKGTERFRNETGMVTLHLRIPKMMQGPEPGGASKRMEVNLRETTGGQVKERIATLLAVPSSGLKVIGGGKVLSDEVPLDLQNIRDGSQVMVVFSERDGEPNDGD